MAGHGFAGGTGIDDLEKLRGKCGVCCHAGDHRDEENFHSPPVYGLSRDLEPYLCPVRDAGHPPYPGRSGGSPPETGLRTDHPLVAGLYASQCASCFLFYSGGAAAIRLRLARKEAVEGMRRAVSWKSCGLFVFHQLYGRIADDRISGAESVSGLEKIPGQMGKGAAAVYSSGLRAFSAGRTVRIQRPSVRFFQQAVIHPV